ncbi:MAG: hypothetical protein HQM10_13465 [Candidatus Riflebacteria bacterium]|nr:hypothetical protein [Candidatus Riflebacteria bacterium]
MTKNYWQELKVEEKIREILGEVEIRKKGDGSPHHFGRPYMTCYQIAIKFREKFPNEFKIFNDNGFPIGGKGTNQHNSFPQYIALQLSKKIDDLGGIEGRFLSHESLETLRYKDNNELIEFSGTNYEPSIFRLK